MQQSTSVVLSLKISLYNNLQILEKDEKYVKPGDSKTKEHYLIDCALNQEFLLIYPSQALHPEMSVHIKTIQLVHLNYKLKTKAKLYV